MKNDFLKFNSSGELLLIKPLVKLFEKMQTWSANSIVDETDGSLVLENELNLSKLIKITKREANLEI